MCLNIYFNAIMLSYDVLSICNQQVYQDLFRNSDSCPKHIETFCATSDIKHDAIHACTGGSVNGDSKSTKKTLVIDK